MNFVQYMYYRELMYIFFLQGTELKVHTTKSKSFCVTGNLTVLEEPRGKSEWINDGFCDDTNNNEANNFDGGDCCGLHVNKRFCIQCRCIRKSFKS